MENAKTHHKFQRAFVTGGAGFIGSHLIDLLLESNHSVYALDNLSYGKREFLPAESHQFRFVQGDILDTN